MQRVLILFAVAFGLLGASGAAQAPRAGLLTDGPRPASVTTLQVASVAGKPVDARNGAVIELLREGEAFDLEIAGYGVPGEYDVWALIKAQDGDAYLPFGPALRQRRPDGDVWILPDVEFSWSKGQQRLGVIRAVALRRGQPPPSTLQSLDAGTVVSTPGVSIAVLRAVADLGGAPITTIGEQTVEPGREIAVAASGDISGRTTEPGDVYVIIHPVSSDQYTLVGPAEIRDGTWYLRDVRFAQAGSPHWRRVDLFAVTAREPLRTGRVDYMSMRRRFVSTSPTVRLWVKEEVAPAAVRGPTLAFTRYSVPAGPVERIAGAIVEVEGCQLSLEGTFDTLPQGRAVYAIVSSTDTERWTVAGGPALLSGNRWLFPQLTLASPGTRRDARHSVYVVAASAIPEGTVDYDTWRSRAVGVSPRLSVRTRGRCTDVAADIALSIAEVNGARVPADGKLIRPTMGRVTVRAEVPNLHVYVGRNVAGSGIWEFEETMTQPDGLRTTRVLAGRAHDGAGAWPEETLVAIAVAAPLPALELPLSDWHPRAVAISPVVSIVDDEAASSTAGISRMRGAWTLLIALAAVAFAIHYFFGVLSPLLRDLGDAASACRRYLLTQLSDIPRPRATESAFGLLLLAAGAFTIVGYFPIYAHVVASALNLPPGPSRSLAVLVIASIVLTGIVAEVTTRYGRGRGEGGGRGGGGFAFAFSSSLLALIAAALLIYQGILYFEFYEAHAADGSLLPFALGSGAVFIGAIEAMNAFWATRLSTDLFAWLLPHVAATPVWILERLARMAERLCDALPRRQYVRHVNEEVVDAVSTVR